MDEALERLAEFVDGIELRSLDSELLHDVKRRVVDSVGCILGAANAAPVTISRRLAARVKGGPMATVVGLSEPSTLEMAAFANTAMVRYLDYNDGLTRAPKGGTMHASDMIPAQLAAAEAVGSTGTELLASIAIAYEVGAALCAVNRVWVRDWDATTFSVVGTAVGVGKLLGLNRDQLKHAASIAASSHIQNHARAVGQLSHWKGCASAEAARDGVFAALLAQEGMTGPEAPFLGESGFAELIYREPFTFDLPVPFDRKWALQLSNFKVFPSYMNSQALIQLVLKWREKFSVDQIKNLHVETFKAAYEETGKEADKWDPRTRETADHSTAFLLAVALVDGTVSLDSFEEARYLDPALRPVMNKITVSENPEFTAKFPIELHQHVTVTLESGEAIDGHVTHGYGHHLNPPSDDALSEKYDNLARRSTQDPQLCDEVREMLWKLDTIDDLGPLFEILRRIRPS